jgi:putative ABC transport system ATP-binding protein
MIELDSITTTFGRGTLNEVRALDRLSLRVPEGEALAIIGSNGSGKSTLLNAIAGNYPIDSGSIVIDGTDVTRMGPHRRAAYIGRVFQNPFSGTAPNMTIAENLRLAALRGLPKRLKVGLDGQEIARLRARAAELGLGLEDRLETPIGLLSGGQRQALTLLMATLRQPRVLLLDEHTSALDPKSAEQIVALTVRIVAEDRLTALMVTHDMEEAVGFGDRLIMMHAGRIAMDISGSGKSELTPAHLLEKFTEVRRTAIHAKP